MISKELFVESINGLHKYFIQQNKLSDALEEYTGEYCMFTNDVASNVAVKLLEDIFKDEEYISYFMYDCEWLENKNYASSITDNDESIKIESWEDVYDFLIKNYEEKEG